MRRVLPQVIVPLPLQLARHVEVECSEAEKDDHDQPQRVGGDLARDAAIAARFLPVASSAGREIFEIARRNESGSVSA